MKIWKSSGSYRTRKIRRHRKIGLALGGGAVLGAAHVGALRALDEQQLTIHCVAGTSIGAFVGALYAFGKSWQEIDEIARDLTWLQAARLKVTKTGILSNEQLGKFVRSLLGDVTFAEARIPLAMIATDIGSGERIVLREGDVAEAVMASTCIPGIFSPVEIDGRMLVDGGICENVPVSVLPELGAEQTIAVDLIANHSLRRPENIVEVLINSFDFALSNASRTSIEAADLLIAPHLQGYNAIDVKQIPQLIEQGYADAAQLLRRSVK
ncbi:patatin-like phospholipase family protein [Spirochaeta africana]|uniref:Putative esterase of the alpha-beta hydrolase superfamily n=1 Tax=Spirochaeta africana (strain ATCC 700263 / DSM 8902 / Z-7692) TaxID=889378 RepID=H9ULI5_SPIAZ|nr:patatin-like phospholipase family protein [Spirochaeta africana]AFG38378.1 putative esterase of the alpha-beta hydrolase superfamily [Spirochaeta africana DSM 8902]